MHIFIYLFIYEIKNQKSKNKSSFVEITDFDEAMQWLKSKFWFTTSLYKFFENNNF